MSTVNVLGLSFGAVMMAFLAKLVPALIVTLVCYIAIKVISKIMFSVIEKTRFERGMKDFLLSAIKIGLWFIAIIIIAGSLGIAVASLVAVLSVAGLALSLSIQGTMSNVFSGITVLATRPFVVDDYVEINGVAGNVVTIGLFYTTVRTLDNKIISVPNSEVTSAKVINYTHESIRRVDLNFCASYSDSTESVKSAIIQAIQADERVLQDPAPFAGLLTYHESRIEYVARAWVKSADYWDVYFALNESVRESFAKCGVKMTYDHINVHMVKED